MKIIQVTLLLGMLAIEDLRPRDFLGITSLQRDDGTLRALRIQVSPAASS